VLAVEKAQAEAFDEAQVSLLESAVAPVQFTLERLRAQAEAAHRLQALEQQLQGRDTELARLQSIEQEAHSQAEALAALTARHAESTGLLSQLDQQLRQRDANLRQLRAHAAELSRVQPSSAAAVEALLHQHLLVAAQALGADAGALYLLDAAGAVQPRAVFGLNGDQLEQGQPALVAAALQRRETLVIDELASDPLWTGQESAADPAANGSEDTRVSVPDASGAGYHSALVIPLPEVDRPDQSLGGLLFLSKHPAAFAPGQLPVAHAAAAQVAFALQAETLSVVWQAQAGPLGRWLAESEPEPIDSLTASVEATQIRPVVVPVTTTVRPSEAPIPLTTAPALPIVRPAEPVPPAASTAPAEQRWTRRLAMPALAVALAVCVLGALALGTEPLRNALGLSGAASTATQSVAPTAILVSTHEATTAATSTPVDTAVVQPTATSAVENTSTATAAPTDTPAPTETAAPTLSPTPGLPPGVTALATVTLSEGIAGRLRDAPNGTVIGGVPGNTQVQVLQGRVTTEDGIVWVEISIVETGASGWFAESLLRYDTPPPAL
jgi:hypothetical protein